MRAYGITREFFAITREAKYSYMPKTTIGSLGSYLIC